jgi:hypothetical protein
MAIRKTIEHKVENYDQKVCASCGGKSTINYSVD